MFTNDTAITWLKRCHEAFAAAQDRLTDLDREIGDADHGLNMNRGFSKVAEKLDGAAGMSLATVLKTAGMTLLSSVGGASGPLYGTLFLKMAAAAGDRGDLDLAGLLDILDKGATGVAERGKAVAGDKTMIDAWGPMIAALRAEVEAGTDAAKALAVTVDAGRRAVEATAPLVARKGRASYLGERSAGHVDPGAASSLIIVEMLADSLGVAAA